MTSIVDPTLPFDDQFYRDAQGEHFCNDVVGCNSRANASPGQRAPFQLRLCVAQDDRNGAPLNELDEVE
jgi:hypothetical protein